VTQEEREAYWRGIIATHRPWDTAKAFVAAMNERDDLLREARAVLPLEPAFPHVEARIEALDARIAILLGEQPRPS